MKCSCLVPVSSWDEFFCLCMAMAIYNYIRVVCVQKLSHVPEQTGGEGKVC